MSSALTATELRRYRKARIRTAMQIIDDHQPDAVGCCTACGRIRLCPAVLDALHQVRRFQTVAASAPTPFDRTG